MGFWKTVWPCFSYKGNNSSKITLTESNTVLNDEERIVDLMNIYFANIRKKSTFETINFQPSRGAIDMSAITKIYKNRISFKDQRALSWKSIRHGWGSERSYVLKLNTKKPSTSDTIPRTVFKKTVDVNLQSLANSINHRLQKKIFLFHKTYFDELKQAKVTPVYKEFEP